MGWERAESLAAAFEARTAAIPYEPKGVLFSEMLFLQACVGVPPPQRILESGRARGQSTHLLAVMFPRSEVVSVERDAAGPDASVAARRLAGLPNVTALFGDSRRLLPRLLRRGDVVLIDGPKGWRSLRLAFELLATRLPRQVFVHDCFQGSHERRFLEHHVPQTLFSDDPGFVTAWRHLDARAWQTLEQGAVAGWRPHAFEGRPMRSYGPTLACIPFDASTSYRPLLRRLGRTALWWRLRRSVVKRLPGSRAREP